MMKSSIALASAILFFATASGSGSAIASSVGIPRAATLSRSMAADPVPAAIAGAAATASATGAVPGGFRALSVSFASPAEGWVLGSIVCGAGRCPALAHTLDAGRTWVLLPGPPTTLNPYPGNAGAAAGISAVRFSDPRNGWAFGPELWATHDGGHFWTRVGIWGAHQGQVVALETARGTAHAVLYGGGAYFRIATTAVNLDNWRVVHLALAIGAGPIPQVQLILAGSTGWVLQNDRTVVNGARLVAGVWRTWRPACGDVIGPAVLAASDPHRLVALCDIGLWSTPAGEHLFRSQDGGGSFAKVDRRLPFGTALNVTASGPSTILTVAYPGANAALIASFDAGRTWHTVRVLGTAPIADLGFTTSSQGVVIAGGRLYMTRNGGRGWDRVAF